MNRRGLAFALVTVFSIALFVILLILALVLLTLDRENVKPVRFALEDELDRHEAHAALIALLRQPVQGTDLTLAQAIAMNDGSDDDRIAQAVRQSLSFSYYQMRISYPGREQVLQSDAFGSAKEAYERTVDAAVPSVTVRLPGKDGEITIEFRFVAADRKDRIDGIMRLVKEEAQTRRTGGGLGA